MVMLRLARRFATDRHGGAMIETLIVINILVLVLAGFIEFGVAMNQWNMAAKAVQVGARLAAVSDPVDSRLDTWEDSAPPGDPVTDTFDTLCDGSEGTCTADGLDGVDGYDAARMGRLFDGSDYDPLERHCDATGTVMGMCDVFPNPNFSAANIRVRYQSTGLGYAGRPGGAVPTITVSLTGVPFQFLLLGSLLGLDDIELPSFATTIVGEDLSSVYD